MTRKELRKARQAAIELTTGYICKKCGQQSPVGVGYATSQQPTINISQCPCGYSVNPL